MIHLPRCVAKILDLAGDGRLNVLRVSQTGGGNWRLDATDGRRLAILQGESLPSKGDDKERPAVTPPETLCLSALLDPSAVALAFKNLPSDDYLGERHVGVLLGKPASILTAGRSVIASEPSDQRYPDIDNVLPKGAALFGATLNPDLLISLLRLASAMSKSRDADSKASPKVELLYYGRDKPIGLRAAGAEGTVLDMLIMPILPPDPPAKPKAKAPVAEPAGAEG